LEPESALDNLESDSDGYRLLQELVPGQTFLCCDVSENIVVLKHLEDDCLHGRQLHPSIKDRLLRVRELPHPRIATLRTVERWRGPAYLVWTYLDGQTWDEALADPSCNLLQLSSALAVTVEVLHQTGIVHGQLHGRNIIVRPDRQVCLTHVSPYLYTDPQADLAAIVELLHAAGQRLPPGISTQFEEMLDALRLGQLSMKDFSHTVLGLEEQAPEAEPPPLKKNQGHRLSSLLMALFIAALGVATWFAAHQLLSKSQSPAPATFPSLRQHASGVEQ
jgi:hypothetical protein